MPAGTTAANPITPAIKPSLELASTRSRSERTTDGTIADFETRYVFCSTSAMNTKGNKANVLMANAINTASTTRQRATIWIAARRPPAMRSSTGPINGASRMNGAKLRHRNSNTRHRASDGSMAKNSVLASATTITASPPIIAAWVMASRRNLEYDSSGSALARGCVTRPSLRDAPAQGWWPEVAADDHRARDQARSYL